MNFNSKSCTLLVLVFKLYNSDYSIRFIITQEKSQLIKNYNTLLVKMKYKQNLLQNYRPPLTIKFKTAVFFTEYFCYSQIPKRQKNHIHHIIKSECSLRKMILYIHILFSHYFCGFVREVCYLLTVHNDKFELALIESIG